MDTNLSRNCPICKSSRIGNLVKIPEYGFCFTCKTAWQKNFPKTFYEEDYFNPKSIFASSLLSPIFNLFYLIRRLYVGSGTKKFWIDVGAGGGEFLQTVSARKKLGVEISKVGLRSMKKAGLETTTDKKYLKENGLNADVISFWHVLEHVEKPWEFLSAARRNLSKSGKIVIGVPNIDSLEFMIFGKHWFHLVPRYHLWHFSPRSVEKVLKKMNFEIVNVDFWSPEHHLTGLIQSFINKSSGSESVLYKYVKRATGLKKISSRDIFWSIFWLTVGMPLILAFWICGALLKRPGTFVVVARKT